MTNQLREHAGQCKDCLAPLPPVNVAFGYCSRCKSRNIKVRCYCGNFDGTPHEEHMDAETKKEWAEATGIGPEVAGEPSEE